MLTNTEKDGYRRMGAGNRGMYDQTMPVPSNERMGPGCRSVHNMTVSSAANFQHFDSPITTPSASVDVGVAVASVRMGR